MKVLVVEDDRNTAQIVKDSLTAYFHTVEVSHDGADGSFLARSYQYDAIVLDYALPKKDGLTVCREIRAMGKTTPIIFISITDELEVKLTALNEGADDYMTKPVSLEELRTRLNVLTRRYSDIRKPVLQIGKLTLDSNKHTVSHADEPIALTRKEFSLLEHFMTHIDTITSRAELMEHIWTADGNPFSNTVEAHIRNLRKKLSDKGLPGLIVNIPGRGYLIRSRLDKNA